MRLCLIPARGGSKRIPRKNIRPFAGRPIIAHSIAAALGCPAIDRVIVSTDDEEIAEVARAAGAEVPFKRPAELSGDHATTLDVIRHALDWATVEFGDVMEALCCLYATAPFVSSADLSEAWAQMTRGDASYVFCGCEYAYPIQRALRIENGRAVMFFPEHVATRSQDLDPAYHDAGQFYWCRPEAVRAGKPLLGPEAALYPVDRSRVVDIDTPADWDFAERLFALMQDERTPDDGA